MRPNPLEKLKKAVFSTKDAKELGISARMLSYFAHKGLITRVSHGVYARNDAANAIDTQSILERVLTEVPQGAIGRLSALKFYGLLDEDPASIEVIVPHDNIPKRTVEDAEFYQAPKKSLRQGIDKKNGIRVTSLDRTLIECLKTGVSVKIVRQAFEEAQRKGLKPSLSQMAKFAQLLRAQGKFEHFKEAIL